MNQWSDIEIPDHLILQYIYMKVKYFLISVKKKLINENNIN